jgi:hypothetical protein
MTSRNRHSDVSATRHGTKGQLGGHCDTATALDARLDLIFEA